MKIEINYVLRGKFVTKTILLRSLDRMLAKIEGAGAEAITVTRVTS